MVNKRRSIILVLVLSLFIFSNVCFANEDKITDVFKLDGSQGKNENITYTTTITNEPGNYEDDIILYIEAATHNLPSNLFDYRDYISVRLTYSKSDYKVYECKVINNQTNKIIENLSEETIYRLFNPEYGKKL